jgi:hypothetical protein
VRLDLHARDGPGPFPAAIPFEGAGFWPLVSMGAILGGIMRSPFTGIIFELGAGRF